MSMNKYEQDKQQRLAAWRTTLDQDYAGRGSKQRRMRVVGHIWTLFDEDGNRVRRIVPEWFA